MKLTVLQIDWILVAICMLLLVYGIAGRMAYDDELLEQKRYCAGVDHNEHPDYKGIYKEVCNKDEH